MVFLKIFNGLNKELNPGEVWEVKVYMDKHAKGLNKLPG
jgi:hypothetical protein